MPTEPSDALYLRGIPQNLKSAYKKWCKRNHIPMTEGVARFLKLVTDRTNPISDEILRQPPVPREFKE